MDDLICRDCGCVKDATEFRLRRAGGATRTRQCRACHRQAEQLRRQAKRSRQHRQAVNKQLARLKNAKTARQIGVVCEALVGCFGGLEGFTAAWRACLEADLARGGYTAIRHLDAVLRLVQHCETMPRPVSEMSDEELLRLASEADSRLCVGPD
jgi:hypothetical protein